MRAGAFRTLVVLVATAGLALGAPSVARADNPQLQATLDTSNIASLSSSTDAVSVGTVFATQLQDDGFLTNLGSLPVTNATVHFAPNSGTGPADVSGDLSSFNQAVHNTYLGTGTETVNFDADRSPATVAAPGVSHQVVTLHMTAGDPPLGATQTSNFFDLFGNVGNLTASNYTLTSGPPGAASAVSEGRFHVNWPSPVPHATYAIVVEFDVTNPNAATYTYKPQVMFQSATGMPAGSGLGTTSVTQTDPQAATVTYSANEVSDWTVPTTNFIGVSMGGQADSTAPPPLLPQASVTAYRFGYVNVSSGTDTIANQSYASGIRGWRGDMQNFQATVVPGPRVQLDTVDSSTWTFTPAALVPADTGVLADLGQGQQRTLNTVAAGGPGTSAVNNTPVTTGYHGSRSMVPASVAPGATQVTTIDITLDDAAYNHGFAEIDVFPHDPSSPPNGNIMNVAGATAPTGSNGEFITSHPLNGGGYAWQISNAAVGTTYTLQVPISVAAGGVFKPFVVLRGGRNTSLAPVTGSSTTILDSQLGGTWTFSSTAPGGVTFQRNIGEVTSSNMQAIAAAATSTPTYTFSLDTTEFTVPAGSTFTPTATVTPVNGFSGTVSFFLSQNGTPPDWPWYVYTPAPFPTITPPGQISAALPLQIAPNLAPGDYTFQVGSNASPLPIPNQFQTVTVHVLAALPQADATIFRTVSTYLGSSADSVTAAPRTLQRSFGASIYNWGQSTLHGPALSLDTTSLTFNPALSTPSSTGVGADLGSNSSKFFDALGNRTAPAVTESLGFDASRTFSATSFAPGGGVQTVTLSVTPQNTSPSENLSMHVDTTDFGRSSGTTIVPGSVVFPAVSGSPYASATSTAIDWGSSAPVAGTTYTIQFQVTVPNIGPTPVTYKPWVSVNLSTYDSRPAVESASTSLFDADLGGTVGFASADAVRWNPLLVHTSAASFGAITPVLWSTTSAPADLTVPVGGQRALHVTIHAGAGVAGPVHLFLSGGDTGGALPNGVNVGCCGPFQGVDGDVVDLPVSIADDVPAGTVFHIYVGSYTSGAPGLYAEPITITVGAAVPIGIANVYRQSKVVAAASVDAISAADTLSASRTWWPDLYSGGSLGLTIPGASISVDQSSQTFTPAVTFPLSTAPRDIVPPNDDVHLDTLTGLGSNAQVLNQSITSGFDVTRSAVPSVIPPGGGTQTVTVTVTPRAPALAGQSLFLRLETDSDIGGTTIDPLSVVTSPLTHGEFPEAPNITSTDVEWNVFAIALDAPYTITYQVQVPNTGSAALRYKPFAYISAFHYTPLATTSGATSVAIPDSLLGGTWTFATSAPIDWNTSVSDETDVILASEAVSTQQVDHFKIQPASSTVNAGTPLGLRITAYDALNHVVTGYVGPVDLTDSAGSAIFGPVAWTNGVGTTTATVPGATLSEKFTVTDLATGGTASITSGAVQVYGLLDHFRVVASPAMGTTATPVAVTVTALDGVGHVLTTYVGAGLTLADSQSAPGLTLPSSLSWTRGVGTGTASAASAIRNDTMTADDGAAHGASGLFSRAGAPTRLTISVLPASVPVTGTATVKVSAFDTLGNAVTSYVGSPTLLDTAGVTTIGAWSGTGVRSATASFSGPAKADRATVTDGAISSPQSNAYNVIGDAVRLAATVAPSNVAQAATSTAKVYAYDSAGNVATGYSGTPTLTDTAAVASFVMPAAVNGISIGTGTFTAPAKADKATAVDGALVSPPSGAFNVIGDAVRLTASVTPANIPVATSATVRITAYDNAGNVATGYSGTPTLTDSSSVGLFVVPAAANGVVTSATMNFTGPAKADKVTPHDGSLTGAPSNVFNVIGAAVSFRVAEAPTSVVRTALATVTTTALDAAGNVATGYGGTVTYSDNLVTPAIASGGYDQVNTNGVIVAHIPFTRGPVTTIKIVVTDTVNPLLTGLSNAFRIT